MFKTLIQAPELRALMETGQPLLVMDCSFDLMNPDAGRQQFDTEHLPGAVYVHLDTDLSDKTRPASEGRHPLPPPDAFAARMAALGVSRQTQVVVMDRQGVNFCGRLWWMLRWCGHEAVAVLDGGLQAWQAAGGAVNRGEEPSHFQSIFFPGPEKALLVDGKTVADHLGQPGQTLVDARAPARFRGEVEPLDPVAGHIPGALNRPVADNIGPDGCFKSAAQLRTEFERLLAGRDPGSVVHHCGSGVSAIPNLLAMEVAGLGRTALYPGSWSEWCNTPGAPCAVG
mgnify:CR=1 FL=1